MSTWVEFLKKKYTGKTVKLQNMANDPNPVKPGTKGIVKYVDDAGHLHVEWEDGRTLSLLVNVDSFDIVK